MEFTIKDIILILTAILTLISIVGVFVKIGMGQGIAKAREGHFVSEIVNLKEQDKLFTESIGGIKDDISIIKINQEQKHSEVKQSISALEINILKELRKTNGNKQ